jgi:hypothetical protein
VIDLRLLEHWQREQNARETLRRALPSAWRDDSRPKMEDVREFYVEAMLRSKVVRSAAFPYASGAQVPVPLAEVRPHEL